MLKPDTSSTRVDDTQVLLKTNTPKNRRTGGSYRTYITTKFELIKTQTSGFRKLGQERDEAKDVRELP